MSVPDHKTLDTLADSVGVELGGFVRHAALRGAADAARDVAEGRVKLRRRGSAVEREVEQAPPRPVREAPAEPLDRVTAFRRMTQR